MGLELGGLDLQGSLGRIHLSTKDTRTHLIFQDLVRGRIEICDFACEIGLQGARYGRPLQ